MQDRPSLYYPGNTVIAPHPGKKRLGKTLDPPGGIVPFEGKLMDDTSSKICAVTQCVWCGFTLGGQYFITCGSCGNCQYCGLIDNVDPYRCFLCGNHLPDELQTQLVKLSTVTGDPVEYNE